MSSQQDGEALRSKKKVNNEVVNILTNEQLDDLVNTWFTGLYKQTKGIPKQCRLDHSTPYLVMIDGYIWANPYAFSSTKKSSEMTGYPTYPLKLSTDQEALFVSPSNKKKKSSWIPRLPVHCVMYRWFNNYAKIQDGSDVSHLAGHTFIVDPNFLIVEEGVTNRSKICLYKV